MDTLDLSTQPWLDIDTVTETLVPFLQTHPKFSQVTLGLVDAVHSRVQRMLASLIDQYPDVQWQLTVHNEASLQAPLYRRIQKAISHWPTMKSN